MMTQTRCHSMHSATKILWPSSRRAGHPVGYSPCRSEAADSAPGRLRWLIGDRDGVLLIVHVGLVTSRSFESVLLAR